jgi:hypothetical protein
MKLKGNRLLPFAAGVLTGVVLSVAAGATTRARVVPGLETTSGVEAPKPPAELKTPEPAKAELCPLHSFSLDLSNYPIALV